MEKSIIVTVLKKKGVLRSPSKMNPTHAALVRDNLKIK